MTKRLKIGIDPGSKTGIAIWNSTDRKFEENGLSTKDFWKAIFFIQGIKRDLNAEIDHITLIIEDPNKNAPVFMINNEKNRILQALEMENKREAFTEIDSVLRVFSRRAQNVGQNKQMATFMIEYFRNIGFKVKEVRPTQTKMKDYAFKAITKYQGRCSQHARDAAMLCIGL